MTRVRLNFGRVQAPTCLRNELNEDGNMATLHSIALDRSTLSLIAAEKTKSLSSRELAFRLLGHGLEIRDMGDRQVVARLPAGNVLGVLPAEV